MNLSRDRNYHGRWDALIEQATDAFNKELKIAERRARNYILDQTNVYSNARQRKMNNFKGYRRIAAVVVCNNEVLKERTAKREREEGKLVPEEAVMKMKANFTLPQVGQIFDDVWFVEEDRISSEKLVKQFQREGQTFKQAAGGAKRPSETKSQTNFTVQHGKNNHSQSSPGHQVSHGNFRDRTRRPTPKGSTGSQNNHVPYKEEDRISTEKHAEQFQKEGQTFKQAAGKAKRPSETTKQNNFFVQHGNNNHSQSSPGHQAPHAHFRDHSRRPTPQSSIGSRNNCGPYKDRDRISCEKHAEQFQREGQTFKQTTGGAKQLNETRKKDNFSVQHGKINHSQSSPGHQVSRGNFRDRSRRPTPKGSTGSRNNYAQYKEEDRISTEKHAEQFQREGQTFKQTTGGAKQLNETRKQDNFSVQHRKINHFQSLRGHPAPHGPFEDRSRRATPQGSFGPRNNYVSYREPQLAPNVPPNYRELPKTNYSWGYSSQSPYRQGQNNRDRYWAHNNGSYEQRQRFGAPMGNQYASGNSYGGWGGRYGAQGKGYSNSGQDDWRAPDQGHIDRMYGHQ